MARSGLVSISVGYPMPLQIILKNTQNVNSPSPFQQMLQLEASEINSVLPSSTPQVASDFHNIRFKYNYSYIPAWLESINNGVATIWVNIPVSIPANSSITIDMEVDPSLNFDGVYWGEAPQLSPTYGEYDNGANVFTQYGGGGSTGWSKFTYVGGAWTTANGYLQQTSTSGSYLGGPAALIESTSYPNNGYYILGMAFNYTTEADARVGIMAVATPTSTPDAFGYRFFGQQSNNGAGFISFLNDQIAWVDNTYQGVVSTPYTMVIVNAGGTWSGNLYSGYGNEISTPLTSFSNISYTAANYEGATSGYVGISAAYQSGSGVIPNPISVMWFYMRAYPPNGVMPSVEVIA